MSQFDEYRKAIHEAGHAAMGFVEGIKVENITVEPIVIDGTTLDGLCQWDNDIVARREAMSDDTAALMAWIEKEAKFLLGGIAAEEKLLNENGLPVKPMNIFAWSKDQEEAAKRIRIRVASLDLDAQEELDRIINSVCAKIDEPEIWAGVCRIAQALAQSRFLTGDEAQQLFRV